MKYDKEKFSYTYSSQQQEEIDRILKKYMPSEESVLDKLRRLDREAERPGTVASVTAGVIGSLVLGFGMCCSLEWELFLTGTVIGMIGIAIIAAAYPLFRLLTKKQRKKIAPQMIELSKTLK